MNHLSIFLIFFTFFSLTININAQKKFDSYYEHQRDSLWEVYDLQISKGNTLQAIAIANQIDEISKLAGDTLTNTETSFEKTMCFFKLEDWSEMQQSLILWNTKLEDLPPSEDKEYLKIEWLYFSGHYHLKMWNHESAAYYFEQIIELDRQAVPIDSITLKDSYLNQGVIFDRFGDYDKGVTYGHHSLRLTPSNQLTEKALIHQNIARSFFQKYNYSKAYAHYHQALALVEKNTNLTKRANSIKAVIYRNMGEYFTTIGQLDSAEYYLQNSISITNSKLGKINNLQRQGKLYISKKNLIKAQENFKIAYELCTETFSERHPETAQTLHTIGKSYSLLKQPLESLSYFQQALIAISRNFNDTDWHQIPPIHQVSNKRILLEILLSKVGTLEHLGNLELALKHYEFIDLLLDEMRQKNITTDESLFYLISESKSIYEKAINTAIQIGKTETAFLFAQKAHGIKLLQHIQNNTAQKISNIPEALLLEERQLKIAIQDLQVQLYFQSDNTTIQRKLFEQQLALEELINRMEVQFPAYYEIRYDLPFSTVADLQKKVLNNKTAIIEYFLGAETIYTFVLTVKGITVFSKKLDGSLTVNVSKFRQLISQLDLSREAYTKFCQTSYQLHQLLLEDVRMTLPSSIEQLIIIPDEIINHVSFAALIKEFPKNNRETNYYQLPYLIHDFDFSYHYSSALLPINNTKSNKNDYVGFAPISKGRNNISRNLEPLPHTPDEVNMIDSIIHGKTYLDSNATLQVFRKSIDEYKIAHLATHATCNDSLPFESKIHFYASSMPIYELYHLEQNLDMVVLSACETGTGQLRKGEGVQSLARAFLQSNCKSVITSLWKVNDEQTPKIMVNFYQNLFDKGNTKSAALANAQRAYLQSNPISYAHPFYWATFIQIGDSQALYPCHSNWFWGLFSLTFLLIFFFLLKIFFR